MNKRLLVFLGLAGLLTGGGFGLYLGLPALAEQVAFKAVSKLGAGLGQQLTWESFTFHRYDRVELGEVYLFDPTRPPGEDPLAYAERIEFRFDPESVLGGKITVREVSVDNPHLNLVRRAEGGDNYGAFVERIRRLASRGAADAGGGGGDGDSPFKYIARKVPELSVRGGNVRLEDQRESSPLRLPALEEYLGEGGPRVVEASGASLRVKDVSPVADAFDLRFEGEADIPLLANSLLVAGKLEWPSQEVELTTRLGEPLRLPVGERLLTVGGLQFGLDGAFELLDVALSVPKGPEDTPPDALRARRIVVSWSAPPEGSEAAKKFRLDELRVVEPELLVYRYADRSTNLDDIAEIAGVGAALVPDPDPDPDPAPGSPAEGERADAEIAEKKTRKKKKKKADKRSGRVKKALVRGFEAFEGRLLDGVDGVLSAGSRLPIDRFVVERGVVRFGDEIFLEKGFRGELDNFHLEAKRNVDTSVFDYELRFETPAARGSASQNTAKARVDLSTGDVQVSASVGALALAPYQALFPDWLPIEESTQLHHTRIDFFWSAETRVARIESSAVIDGLPVYLPAVAERPMRFPSLGFDGTMVAKFDQHSIQLESGRFSLGQATARVASRIDKTNSAPVVHLQVDVPEVACQKVFDGLPSELVPILEGAKFAGTVAWSLRLDVDSADWDTLDYDAAVPALRGARAKSLGSRVSLASLRGPFLHQVEEPDGTAYEFMTGPGAPGFVPYGRISPWMTQIITTTEDGRFFRHRGFSPRSIYDSIVKNLKTARYARGASTVTQQLSKNLFLTRQKTISRKVQEALIAWQLEDNLTKEEILELYFNIIEFGPGIYGIKRAANHYFRKHPQDLELIECIFLASLIPNPKKYYSQYKRGVVSPNWSKKLRYFGKAMLERGKITQPEFDALEPFSPIFWNSPLLEELAAEEGEPQTPDVIWDEDTENDRPIGVPDPDEPGIIFDPGQ